MTLTALPDVCARRGTSGVPLDVSSSEMRATLASTSWACLPDSRHARNAVTSSPARPPAFRAVRRSSAASRTAWCAAPRTCPDRWRRSPLRATGTHRGAAARSDSARTRDAPCRCRRAPSRARLRLLHVTAAEWTVIVRHFDEGYWRGLGPSAGRQPEMSKRRVHERRRAELPAGGRRQELPDLVTGSSASPPGAP